MSSIILCFVLCVGSGALQRAHLASKESYQVCIVLRNWKVVKNQQNNCRVINNNNIKSHSGCEEGLAFTEPRIH
jgi:hypothetical protein